jgi:hypothetical protein
LYTSRLPGVQGFARRAGLRPCGSRRVVADGAYHRNFRTAWWHGRIRRRDAATARRPLDGADSSGQHVRYRKPFCMPWERKPMDQGDLADHILAALIGARAGDAMGAGRASLDQWAVQRSPMSQLSSA